MAQTISINRATVFALWAEIVAERPGFDQDEVLTPRHIVGGLNVHSNGISLILFALTSEEIKAKRAKLCPKETITMDLLRRTVLANKYKPDGFHVELVRVPARTAVLFTEPRPDRPATKARYFSKPTRQPAGDDWSGPKAATPDPQ